MNTKKRCVEVRPGDYVQLLDTVREVKHVRRSTWCGYGECDPLRWWWKITFITGTWCEMAGAHRVTVVGSATEYHAKVRASRRWCDSYYATHAV